MLEAATLTMVAEDRELVLEQVADAMLDNDHDVVIDALSAASVLARASVEDETRDKFAAVTTKLVQGIQWRYRVALADRLRIVADLVKNQPWFFFDGGLCRTARRCRTNCRGDFEWRQG